MEKDKAEKVKEIVEKMQKKTPQKSKNPSLVLKEIKKELKKEDVVEKKEKKKKESGKIKGPGIPDGTGPCSDTPECQMNKKKEKIDKIVEKVKASLLKK